MRNSGSICDYIFGVSRRSANNGGTHCHKCKTKLCSHLTFNAPGPFLTLSVCVLKTSPHERLPGQEAVSTPRSQAQGRHTEVLSLPHLHRKVCKRSVWARVTFSGCLNKFYILDFFQMVDHQWPVCSKQPLSLLWQVLPNVALWRPWEQDRRILGLPLCRPRCI